MQYKITLNNQEISFSLKRNRLAKQARMLFFPDGRLTISAPKRISLKFIYAWLTEKADLVLHHITKQPISDTKTRLNTRKNYLAQRENARALAHAKIIELNQHYNFPVGRLSIKNQKTCWGSCSRQHNLNFNYRLIYLPEHLVNYLIVHELCHIQEMNHSPRFWALVAQTIPEYKKARRELRRTGRELI